MMQGLAMALFTLLVFDAHKTLSTLHWIICIDARCAKLCILALPEMA